MPETTEAPKQNGPTMVQTLFMITFCLVVAFLFFFDGVEDAVDEKNWEELKRLVDFYEGYGFVFTSTLLAIVMSITCCVYIKRSLFFEQVKFAAIYYMAPKKSVEEQKEKVDKNLEEEYKDL